MPWRPAQPRPGPGPLGKLLRRRVALGENGPRPPREIGAAGAATWFAGLSLLF